MKNRVVIHNHLITLLITIAGFYYVMFIGYYKDTSINFYIPLAILVISLFWNKYFVLFNDKFIVCNYFFIRWVYKLEDIHEVIVYSGTAYSRIECFTVVSKRNNNPRFRDFYYLSLGNRHFLKLKDELEIRGVQFLDISKREDLYKLKKQIKMGTYVHKTT